MHEKIQFADLHKINLTDVELKGRILDIGGGGEGIIGQLKGEQVVAIDPKESELKEATPGDYLKIIMDAKYLQFLDETFDTTTAFFTLMYIPLSEHQKVFKEIYRVTKKDGEFVIWDLKIPKRESSTKDFYGLYLEVKVEEKEISTGYATKWDKEQDLEYYLNLGTSFGFRILESDTTNEIFYIRFQKE
ncbi:MAG: methyltransferase domain-containing protein [Candidatus Lokiarchaeota archaeon]|nr:methyltransferase domain-containing protein [Candidatus Lokiarchaeota archaeon]